jgi:hypothetical protein
VGGVFRIRTIHAEKKKNYFISFLNGKDKIRWKPLNVITDYNKRLYLFDKYLKWSKKRGSFRSESLCFFSVLSKETTTLQPTLVTIFGFYISVPFF